MSSFLPDKVTWWSGLLCLMKTKKLFHFLFVHIFFLIVISAYFSLTQKIIFSLAKSGVFSEKDVERAFQFRAIMKLTY